MKYQRRIRKHRYLHVADELRDGILSARWRPGDLLPSESQLCQEFGVSRGTVVKAIEVLLADGLAHRRQGSGTFEVVLPEHGRTEIAEPLGTRCSTLQCGFELLDRFIVPPVRQEHLGVEIVDVG